MRNRPRPVWLALAAAGLLAAFSVTSALGAGPPEDKANHGQEVSDFVHDLLFGDQDSGDEDAPEDEDVTAEDEEEPADEEVTDEESADGLPDNHGQCVRVVAMGDDTGGPNDNHGWAVSEAARFTCSEDSDAEDAEEPEEASVDGQPDNHGACVSQVAKDPVVGGPKDNHGGAVSGAARTSCREGSDGGGDEG
jgi:hypothetical protein